MLQSVSNSGDGCYERMCLVLAFSGNCFGDEENVWERHVEGNVQISVYASIREKECESEDEFSE